MRRGASAAGRRVATAVLVTVLLAACSSSGKATAPTTSAPASSTTATLPPSINVRVVIKQAGLGCTGDNPMTGTGSRVVAKDAAGAVVGTGTFALTPGADVCDWQARVPLSSSPDFLTIDGDVRELATVARSDYEDGGVVITITAGTARVT